ncbi:hypothetical protein BH10ACI2_BH10ACI2_17840 [soil metagenome]
MTDESGQIKALEEALTALIKFVPKTRLELDEWYNQANCILERPDLLQGCPHFIWHYLADADIRMKDDSYLEMQNQRIGLMLQQLNRGQMPSDEKN